MYSSYSNFYDVVLFSFTRTSAESNMDNNVANISFIVIIETDIALRGFVHKHKPYNTSHHTFSILPHYLA